MRTGEGASTNAHVYSVLGSICLEPVATHPHIICMARGLDEIECFNTNLIKNTNVLVSNVTERAVTCLLGRHRKEF